ncbi:patatin-like phospholipase family protein [Rhodoblastus acidophilus]|uniref:Patatin-like phospholipase family protein n=1 Tax=Candidatus Rhodoblastus alkanivorans TaxID=2954117 RepID=A0ABS9Z5E2_9HYPH|nr:patatin-like phospholipase family protein [Candidatus Rhodoblastus alkanivorans]MCI4678474.1 patatin-like phospholipase family protein [Candidatus Rhodoblastus alkanivorans]MCI4682853.1 patatin-like phospholipase family protein [Candidatus Rhodoblastus alkanivorans]MDI4640162.1 patatin-like phospholipase family protein [Rhodoblastus acidophilus]
MDIIKAALDLRRPAISRSWPPDRLALALQGGGSFGAFTWGALERLLEDERIALDAFSGASAGAVNAALLVSGLAEGGREGARKTLNEFWAGVSQSAAFLPKAVTLPFGFLARALSPYQFNPFDLNPLRVALESHIDFERLRHVSSPRLLIAATRVSTASLRIFRNEEITSAVILASACLPLIHQSIEIDGELYWDGGYIANPPLTPLVTETNASDVLIIQISQTKSEKAPRTRQEIERRIEQINFASTLDREIEAIRLLAPICAGGDASGKWAKLRLDRLSAEDEIEFLAEHSPANLEWSFLSRLREAGRAAAENWLMQTGDFSPHFLTG